MNGSKFPKPEVEIIDRLQRSRILLDSYESKISNNIFDDLTLSGKSYFSIKLVVYCRIRISEVQRRRLCFYFSLF